MKRKNKTTGSGTPLSVLRGFLVQRLALARQASLTVALSGGVDSTVLLHTLHSLAPELHFRLRAVHVNHQLHRQAKRWAAHCRKICRRLKVPLQVVTVRVQGIDERGPEAAARAARYRAFEEILKPGEYLLTAHHLDDQAETVLLQLLRGAGVRGLSAMPDVAAFARGLLVRPFLPLSRENLVGCATHHGLSWVDDPSNANTDLARNFLRHEILPRLHTHWPNVATRLARSARHFSAAQSLLDEQAASDLVLARINASEFSIDALRQLPPARLLNAIRYAIRDERLPLPSESNLNEIADALTTVPKTRYARIEWSGGVVRRYRDRLQLLAREPEPARFDGCEWDIKRPLTIGPWGITLTTQPTKGEGLSRERINGKRVTVYPRKGGERCRLLGRRHRHLVKKLLQAAGLSPWQRARLPLIYVGSELAAIGDRWVCEPYAAETNELGFRIVLENTGKNPTK